MKNRLRLLYALALPCCLLALSGCSEEANVETVDNTPVELQVNPVVATLTRSAIGNSGSSGSAATDALKKIAVYAQSTTTNTHANSNNYALYSYSSGWTSGTDKIYLSSEDATIYAYHPAYQPGSNGEYKDTGTALKASTDDVTDASTIGISVYPGGEGTEADYTITAVNNADKKFTSSWGKNDAANTVKIASAPGEVDYMWATPVEADNGKGNSAKGNGKNLTMNHALAMLSFRIYNDGTYNNEGKLTKITLKNSVGTTLTKGSTPTMKIKDGTVSPGSAAAVTYTRVIKDGGSDFYQIITTGSTASASVATMVNDARDASKKFSILVMPEAAASSKNDVQAVFAIDGVDYTVPLTKNSTTIQWQQGNDYLYSVKLSGTELSISDVTVANWQNATGGDLVIQ